MTFLESLKIFLINLVIFLMMSAEMATPGLFRLTVLWSKCYYAIILVGNSSISFREVITTAISLGLDQKSRFSWEVVLVQFQEFGTGTNLKFYTSVAKVLKLKVRKFWGLIFTFAEVRGEKLVGRAKCCR